MMQSLKTPREERYYSVTASLRPVPGGFVALGCFQNILAHNLRAALYSKPEGRNEMVSWLE